MIRSKNFRVYVEMVMIVTSVSVRKSVAGPGPGDGMTVLGE